jgi:YesN/AraC family two-component response regulator
MDEISLEHLASCMDITPQYLCRLFKEAFSVTPFTYLAKYRIKKAKELLLLNKSLTIREVSHAVGYNDVSYFCSLFRKYEGMAPGVFRKAHQ